jgi:CSLREA domain-containing protein
MKSYVCVVMGWLLIVSAAAADGGFSGVAGFEPSREEAFARASTSATSATRAYAPTSIRPIVAIYAGDDRARRALEAGDATPTGLVAADVDEDGVRDMICAYANEGGGVLALHRGRLDALFPSTPTARRRGLGEAGRSGPFQLDAQVWSIGTRPDFVAAGDFDDDGHVDVVLARRGGATVDVLLGDGSGRFEEGRSLDVPGGVTALAVGEIDRRDAVVDLAIATKDSSGSRIVVFTDRRGAVHAEAEIFGVPEEVRALLFASVDAEDASPDLVLASGRQLLQLRGERRGGETRSAPRVMAELPSSIHALSFGDFVHGGPAARELAALGEDGFVRFLRAPSAPSPDGEEAGGPVGWNTVTERALVTPGSSPGSLVGLRGTGNRTRDLLGIDRNTREVRVLSGVTEDDASGHVEAIALPSDPVAALPMRAGPDALDDLAVAQRTAEAPTLLDRGADATITVNSTDDTATSGDGRCTLREAILNANADADTSGGDCAAGSGLDDIAFSIDGGGAAASIAVTSELPTLTGPVTINGNTQGCGDPPCIELEGSLLSGTERALVTTAAGATIRGLAINRFPDWAIMIESDGNYVEGNILGLDRTGAEYSPNFGGVYILDASDNVIGGTQEAARNVISGNEADGIFIWGVGGPAVDDQVLGNYIGTDASGTVDRGNLLAGVEIEKAEENVVGGTTPGSRNLISANDNAGILLQEGRGHEVSGNYIGLDQSGTAILGNAQEGIRVLGSRENTIGGATEAARNVISANGGDGIHFFPYPFSAADFNLVLGNYVGTDVTGTVDLGNGDWGIQVNGDDNTIGGTTASSRNVISGNEWGVTLANHHRNEVLGNYIGTDATGARALGNEDIGIAISGSDNIIGGAEPGAGNVISANKKGVGVAENGGFTIIRGNRIGTDASGRYALGNRVRGVTINSAHNTVGGAGDGEANLIAFNGTEGIMLRQDALHVAVLRNAIHSNGTIGIDLGDEDGVTPNDPGDGDTGPNGLQNFPVLDQADATPSPSVTVGGTLDSAASTSYRIEFFACDACDPSGHGEGERYLGFADRTTAPDGTLAFSVTLTAPVSDGASITATATDPENNTSEFSACHATTCSDLVVHQEMIVASEDEEWMTWPTPADVHYAKGDLAGVAAHETFDDGWRMNVDALDISMDEPAPGTGIYYLVRPLGCGSWQTEIGAEPERDDDMP